MQKTIITTLFLTIVCALNGVAQELNFTEAKFKLGDNMEWKNPSFDCSDWQTLSMVKTWNNQGINKEKSFGWYIVRFTLPKTMLNAAGAQAGMEFNLGKIDDADEAYLNGELIGKTGSFPTDKGGYRMKYHIERVYKVDTKSKAVKWGQENVLAIRMYNGTEDGGMYSGGVHIRVANVVDGVLITSSEPAGGASGACSLDITNDNFSTLKGTVKVNVIDMENNSTLSTTTQKVSIKSKAKKSIAINYPTGKACQIATTYTDKASGASVTKRFAPKYILTPAAPTAPRFNGAPMYGVRPGSPVIYRIPVSGERPMRYSVKNMPEGLSLDAEKGVISGSLAKQGDYTMTIVAQNDKGKVEQNFTIKVGLKLALTPPMGWNSWNCWGLSVSQEKVISSAQALIDKGLADYGYSYINVDDAWEAPERNADGTIAVNEKFPDMKGLGDWLHSNGLKFGIYSSPGDRTCGNYLGSLDHEEQDAKTYNSWGIDYLKYDWCGYSKVYNKEGDRTTAAFVRPYLLMQKFLRQQPRDIFYSLCQYGMADVWTWGHAVDANSWRTTGDITDTWASLYNIGFERQAELYPYAGPGHWNDPDMLIVGKVGWSANLRDSRLTPDEQYTHISLWSLLASNMLIGCDIAQIDDFTLGLLCNNEVNAVNQDILGKQAKREVKDGNIQIWKRPLSDGSYAVGIFNLGSDNATVDFSSYFATLGIKSLNSMRDLWRQKDLNTASTKFLLAPHGVRFLKIKY